MHPLRKRFHAHIGFTLLETTIYTFLVAIVLSGFILIVQATLSTQTKFKTRAILHENLRFTLQKIESRAQGATSITLPLSGATGTRLVLALSEASKNPSVFEIRDGALLFTEGNGPETPLTARPVEVTEFVVTHLATTPPSIRILLRARTVSETNPAEIPITIQETISIRR